MGNMHIVTGYRNERHITAEDAGSLNAAIFGTGNYVLNRGRKFEIAELDNNTVRVYDGDLMMQGRHIRLNDNSYVDLTVEVATQYTYRNDLIVARYTKDADTGVEDCNLIVLQGVESEGNAEDPAYTEGDILNDHVYIADFPLYRLEWNGIHLSIEGLFSINMAVTKTIVVGSDLPENVGGLAVGDIYIYLPESDE